jgi:hypothetical protein
VGILHDRMRNPELAGPAALAAKCLDELAVLTELQHPVIPVTVGDEEVAVLRDQHIGGLVEGVRAIARDAILAQRHHELAVGLKFLHLMRARVRYPDEAVAIHTERVPFFRDGRLAPLSEKVAAAIELPDNARRIAFLGMLPAGAAPPQHIYDSFRIDIHPGDCPQRLARGQMKPILHRMVGGGRRRGCLALCQRGQDHHEHYDRRQHRMPHPF